LKNTLRNPDYIIGQQSITTQPERETSEDNQIIPYIALRDINSRISQGTVNMK